MTLCNSFSTRLQPCWDFVQKVAFIPRAKSSKDGQEKSLISSTFLLNKKALHPGPLGSVAEGEAG